MFLEHFAAGLAAKRAGPRVSLASWFAAARLVDPIWPVFLLVAYFGAAFGPPAPDVRRLAFTGLAGWLLIPWASWADRNSALS